MINRITIYGWVVPVDRFRGAGSGTLVDLVYFVDDTVTVSEIISLIRTAGYKLIPKRVDNRRYNPVEQDKVTVEDWSDHIIVGAERVGGPEYNPNENYDRYNYPSG